MINVSIDTSELKAFAQNLPQIKDQIFDLMNLDIRSISSQYLGTLRNVKIQCRQPIAITEMDFIKEHLQ